jgi:hypothetical protein
MSDIVFECPHCQQSLVVDSGGVGVQIDCPGCGSGIVIPAGAPAEPEMLTVVNEVDFVVVPQRGAPDGSGIPRFRDLLDESARAILPILEKAAVAIRRSLDQR